MAFDNISDDILLIFTHFFLFWAKNRQYLSCFYEFSQIGGRFFIGSEIFSREV